MHKVVGIGLIVLLVGYVMWIATAGTSVGQEETVVINTGDARNPSEEQRLDIVTLSASTQFVRLKIHGL